MTAPSADVDSTRCWAIGRAAGTPETTARAGMRWPAGAQGFSAVEREQGKPGPTGERKGGDGLRWESAWYVRGTRRLGCPGPSDRGGESLEIRPGMYREPYLVGLWSQRSQCPGHVQGQSHLNFRWEAEPRYPPKFLRSPKHSRGWKH